MISSVLCELVSFAQGYKKRKGVVNLNFKKIVSGLILGTVFCSMVSCTKEEDVLPIYSVDIYNQSELSEIVKTKGYVNLDGEKHSINTKLNDQVITQVNVVNGQKVSQGDVLCIFDTTELNKKKKTLESEKDDYMKKYNHNISVYESKIEQAKNNQNLKLDEVNETIESLNNKKQSYEQMSSELQEKYDTAMSEAESYKNSDDPILQTKYVNCIANAEQIKQTIDIYDRQIIDCNSSIDQQYRQYDITLSETNQQIKEAEHELATYKIENNKESEYQNNIDDINKKINESTIKSEYNGIVTDLNAVQGLDCMNGLLMNVTEADSYCLEIGVSQNEYEKLDLDMTAELRYTTAGKLNTLEGKVSSISNVIGQDKKFEAEIKFESEKESKLAVGMEMNVDIFIKKYEDVYAVSNNALIQDEDGLFYVMTAKRERASVYRVVRRNVEIGDVCGNYTIINGGDISMGELVILFPASLKAGDLINLNTSV